jgi:hypothetical protein
MCLRRSPAAIVAPPCDAAPGTAPMADALAADGALYNALVDAFSMRNFAPSLASGHDHFFATFSAFDARRESAAATCSPRSSPASPGRTPGTSSRCSPSGWAPPGASAAPRAGATTSPPLRARLPEGRPRRHHRERPAPASTPRRRGCASSCAAAAPTRTPGCRVTVRYVVQVIRTQQREDVFAQVAAAVRVIQGDRRVVALNLVAPEDDPVRAPRLPRPHARRRPPHAAGHARPGDPPRGRAHADARPARGRELPHPRGGGGSPARGASGTAPTWPGSATRRGSSPRWRGGRWRWRCAPRAPTRSSGCAAPSTPSRSTARRASR